MNESNYKAPLRLPGGGTATGSKALVKKGGARQLRIGRPITTGAEKSRGILGMMLAVFVTATCALPAHAQNYTVDLDTPTLDKWVYPFASAGGGPRTTAPVFGAVGSSGSFDDRDGQFFVGFSMSGQVPSGQGALNYQISSATLTLRLSFGVDGMVVYDGTYDAYTTYDPASGSPINGDDPGRPLELYGAAYRNGLTATSVLENTPFAPTGGNATGEGVRNIYPTDLANGARDVSNNIRDAFDSVPFAIGRVAAADLNLDGTMKGDIDVVFTLNLLNPNVVSYLQQSLDEGHVNFLSTSLHQASQGGPATRPEFDAKELGAAGVAGRLDMQVAIVPEPNAAWLLMVGASFFACSRKRAKLSRGMAS
ncbi:MAG: hypothetical protein V4710_08030 [Verrucomicrobiota bacterium]